VNGVSIEWGRTHLMYSINGKPSATSRMLMKRSKSNASAFSIDDMVGPVVLDALYVRICATFGLVRGVDTRACAKRIA
jgi:hypothetical protein